jgi:hypothetical protein
MEIKIEYSSLIVPLSDNAAYDFSSAEYHNIGIHDFNFKNSQD